MSILEVGPVRAYFMLDLSTAHLPMKTVAQINRGEFYRNTYMRSEYGFIFHISPREDINDIKAELMKCPCPAFRAALKLAWDWKLRFISYDQDADIHYDIEELPVYDW